MKCLELNHVHCTSWSRILGIDSEELAFWHYVHWLCSTAYCGIPQHQVVSHQLSMNKVVVYGATFWYVYIFVYTYFIHIPLFVQPTLGPRVRDALNRLKVEYCILGCPEGAVKWWTPATMVWLTDWLIWRSKLCFSNWTNKLRQKRCKSTFGMTELETFTIVCGRQWSFDKGDIALMSCSQIRARYGLHGSMVSNGNDYFIK